MGRETAHEVIKEHAVAAVMALRTGETSRNDLLDRLAGDARLGIAKADLEIMLDEGKQRCGNAQVQVDHFVSQVDRILARVPEAKDYTPGSIL